MIKEITTMADIEDPQHLSMAQRISMIKPTTANQVVKASVKQGTAIFSKDDLYTTYDTLALLLRYLCIREQISMALFEERHRLMAQQTLMSANKRSYDFSNKKRSLIQARVSWDLIEKFCQIMGYDILDISLNMSNRNTGEIFTISKSEIMKLLTDPELPHISIMENEQAETQARKVKKQKHITLPEGVK